MQDTFSLDSKTCAWIERNLAQMKALESGLQGALSLLVEQHSLEGRWQLDLPNKQLVRADAPQEISQVA